MKKAAILTLYGYCNYGNRLQNYAVQQVMKKCGYDCETLVVYRNYKPLLRPYLNRLKALSGDIEAKRYLKFYGFTKKYIPVKHIISSDYSMPDNIASRYDCFVTGSDQVWNPHIRLKERQNFFLSFADKNQRICISPSFGVEEIPEDCVSVFTEGLDGFNMLCSREKSGVEIIKKLTGRDAELIIDPTLAIKKEEWEEIFAPKKSRKDYIVIGMLGDMSKERLEYIKGIADKNNFEIIDFFADGSVYAPDEALRLIDGAKLVFTDSFHFTAFSINFKTPFIVCPREQDNINAATFSRLASVLSLFGFSDRIIGSVPQGSELTCDFEHSSAVLEKEREKFFRFLQESLDFVKE